MNKQNHTEAAPADDKSGKAAGESQPIDKNGKKDSDNPTNGQSIAQIAEGEGSKPSDSKVRRNRAEIEKDELFDELKKENREMKKMIRDEVIPTIKDLQEQIKKGGSRGADAKDEIEALIEGSADPEFTRKLANALLSKSKKQFEDEYLSDIKDIKLKTEAQSKEINTAQITGAISKEFDRVIADNPELAKIAKKEAVRKYIMSSEENLGRTMEDILEELYGDAVKPEPGMEGYSSQGGNHPKEPDYTKPTEDDHKRIAESREKGGKEFDKYQESLIDRLTQRSRHRNK